MSQHPFQLRASFRYSGEDNKIDAIDAEVLTEAGWSQLEIANTSPGFLIFVYSFLICQHTYFHANCGEHGMLLDRVGLELLLTAGDDWKIDKVKVSVNAVLRAGEADSASIDYIKQRMRQCPVSINLQEPPDYRIDLQFS